jgi:hypothetical protein
VAKSIWHIFATALLSYHRLKQRDENVHGLFADTVGPGHETGMTVGRTM